MSRIVSTAERDQADRSTGEEKESGVCGGRGEESSCVL